MKNPVHESAGIEWVDGSKLGDVALLHDSRDGMQALTSKLETVAKKVGLQINVAKTLKFMSIGNWTNQSSILVDSEQVEECQDFCYLGLGSTVASDGGCDRDIEVRSGNANAAFARLGNIWASKILSTEVKIRLYESLVLSIP